MNKVKLTLFIGVIAAAYVWGVMSFRGGLFPIPQLKWIIYNDRIGLAPTKACPRVNPKKLAELEKLSRTIEIENIFWGDSVVEQMHDSRLYGLSEFLEIAQGGQVIYCALQEIDYILSFNPKNVLIYLGGNDADGVRYDSSQALLYYEHIVDKFLERNINPIIHLVHKASRVRDRLYVEQLNSGLTIMAKTRNLQVIPSLDEFSSDQLPEQIVESPSSRYTYDGEHLTPEGYQLWIAHIKKYVDWL